MRKCKICQNAEGNRSHSAKEMMFGLAESFIYTECSNCGCLQIDEVPVNIARYYPENYYSFNTKLKQKDNPAVACLKRHRANHVFGRHNFIGSLFWNLSKHPVFYDYFQRSKIDLNSSILDVGCGEGKLLIWMKREGFSNLTGIDPYLKESIDYGNGLIIHKMEIDELEQEYDFIMLHHSFEHMKDPVDVLQKLSRMIKKDHYILIRIPVAQSYAWKEFGTNWIALDAPRHLFLHTPASMRILAAGAGLIMDQVVYDSGAQQFWGSIQYQKGITFMEDRSFYVNPANSIFTSEEIEKFEKQAKVLNENQQGDTACFYLRKK